MIVRSLTHRYIFHIYISLSSLAVQITPSHEATFYKIRVVNCRCTIILCSESGTSVSYLSSSSPCHLCLFGRSLLATAEVINGGDRFPVAQKANFGKIEFNIYYNKNVG